MYITFDRKKKQKIREVYVTLIYYRNKIMLGLIERFESETVVTQIKQENLIFIVVPQVKAEAIKEEV